MPKLKISPLLLGPVIAVATMTASAGDRMYGAGAPFSEGDLPPGQLRSALESLPPTAKARALHWLHSFSFPEADIEQIHLDADGGVYYVETEGPAADDMDTAAAGSESSAPATEAISASEAFSLHSKPGAPNTIYIDFDGEVISGRAWNGSNGDLVAKPYDTDNSPESFSAEELRSIAEVWHRVADDYSAFDVDVTTERPSNFNSRTGHILVTDDTDENGKTMPSYNAGGVAYVGVFGSSNYQYYSPALVYATNLGSGFAPFIAEAASHEMGHNMGLSHDGTSTTSYYGGHGSGMVNWAPIMGTGYYNQVSQWSNGDYANANNTQDDLAIVSGKLTGAGDDHGDSLNSASPLYIAADGSISATNPETDPHNTQPENKGIIGLNGDVDLFSFYTADGTIDLTTTPAWAAYREDYYGRGANLDIKAELLDAQGGLISSADDQSETHARITVSVAAGTYYLRVSGVGSSISPYSDYGSQGEYFISGSIAPDQDPDTQPPSPNPMSWDAYPSATGPNSMSMTAITAADDRSSVQYYFACVSGPACSDSGWQSSPSYNATGLAADSSYTWQVKARDASSNETSYSAQASATTASPPPAPTAPDAPEALVAADTSNGSAQLSWVDVASNEDSYEIVRESWHAKRGTWRSTTVIAALGANSSSYTDASGTGKYRYMVRAKNSVGSADSGWSEVIVTDTGSSSSGGGGGSCKGGPKKCG